MRLHPAVDRGRLGDEMIATFRQLPPQRKGWPRAACFTSAKLRQSWLGPFANAGKVTGGDSTWLWSRTGRFAMRTEFRFPKTAAVRMTIILAGVISAIQTGEAIPARFGALDVLPAVLVGLAMFYAAQD